MLIYENPCLVAVTIKSKTKCLPIPVQVSHNLDVEVKFHTPRHCHPPWSLLVVGFLYCQGTLWLLCQGSVGAPAAPSNACRIWGGNIYLKS